MQKCAISFFGLACSAVYQTYTNLLLGLFIGLLVLKQHYLFDRNPVDMTILKATEQAKLLGIGHASNLLSCNPPCCAF